jgi:peptidoglycan/LPS O-acetylase OafA/YrhL
VLADSLKASPEGVAPNATRNLSLQGTRGLAALVVVACHCAAPQAGVPAITPALSRFLASAGTVAVAVFFMLSGFLLFRDFAAELLFGTARTHLPRYFERRFLRIYPAYWMSLIGCVAVLGTSGTNGGVFGLLTLTERYTNSGIPILGLAVYWTLFVEIAFYVFLPVFTLLVRFISRRFTGERARIRVLVSCLALLALVSPLYIGFIVSSNPTDQRLVSGLPRYLGWFAAGMLLTVLAELRSRQRSLPAPLLGFVDRTWACWLCAATGLAFVIAVESSRPPFDSSANGSTGQIQSTTIFLGLAAFFFLLPLCLASTRGSGIRALESPTMLWMGAVSYGLYLWHLVVIMFIVKYFHLPGGLSGFCLLFTLTLPLSLFIGWLSSRLIEKPALRLAR